MSLSEYVCVCVAVSILHSILKAIVIALCVCYMLVGSHPNAASYHSCQFTAQTLWRHMHQFKRPFSVCSSLGLNPDRLLSIV